MAGNSARRGAVRKGKKGATVGSGGQRRRGLSGKGPTPRAEERTGHPARRRAATGARREDGRTQSRRSADAPELLLGRNPVAEALRAKVPATALYVAIGLDADDRVTEAIRLAGNRNMPLLEVSRAELDRMTGGLVHQGLALAVPPFGYAELPDLLARAAEARPAGLLVAVDGVTDPRNLGAIIRSALAFGSQGVVIPQRRAAGVTPAAWRTSAGAAARLPVARATNLVRALRDCQKAGLFVVGLDADGDVSLDELEVAVDPVVVVVGSEGRGLSRLAAEACDLTVRIPMAEAAESLNASVAAAVTLAEIARRRRGEAGHTSRGHAGEM
jgi:23S rRNA (guanosine2251-2'-O)-methyltransferase